MKCPARLLRDAVTFVFLLSLPGCGGIGSFTPLPVPCGGNCPPTPTFLYATSTNHILAFPITPSTGALGMVLSMAGPNQSTSMTSTITLGHLYVSDFLNDKVDGFSINSTTGGLTTVTGSPFTIGATPPGAGGLSRIVSGGSLLYATDLNAGKVAGFTFDSASGTLTPVPNSPFAAGDTPVQATSSGVQGKFLYVSNLNDSKGGISAYAVAQLTGELTPVAGSPFSTGAAGSFPGPSAMVSTDSFLYVALAGTSTANHKIAAFAIDQDDGSLTPLPDSPYTTGNNPLYMAFVPTTLTAQAFLYIANVDDGTISAFTADDNTGVLTPIAGSPYTSGTSIKGLAVTPNGTNSATFFLYAADPDAQKIVAYSIDGTTGVLTALPGSPYPAGAAPQVLTVATKP